MPRRERSGRSRSPSPSQRQYRGAVAGVRSMTLDLCSGLVGRDEAARVACLTAAQAYTARTAR